MAFSLNIFRSFSARQLVVPVINENVFVMFGRQIHTVKTYSMAHSHLSSTTNNDVACGSYKSTKNLREKVRHTLIDNDESTKVRIMPSRKPIPLPEDDFTNTQLRKNYSRPI